MGDSTQICVLSHVTTQMEAIERRQDWLNLSKALPEPRAANTAFGIDGKLIGDARSLGLRNTTLLKVQT